MTRDEFIKLLSELAGNVAGISMDAITEVLSNDGILGLPRAGKIMQDGMGRMTEHHKIIAEYDRLTAEVARLKLELDIALSNKRDLEY